LHTPVSLTGRKQPPLLRKNQGERPLSETKSDIYTRITNRIVADLERGVRPWHRPWSAEHAAGKIIRPLRHNGHPLQGH
jgi:antirestriction protein ArdC